MLRIVVILCMSLCSLLYTFSEDNTVKTIKPIVAEWKDTLMYGIADQMIAVLKEIRNAKESSLNNELIQLFAETINDKLKIEILDFFNENQYPGLESVSLAILDNYEEFTGTLVTKCIKYLAVMRSPDFIERTDELVETTNNNISLAAIQALGDMEDSTHTEFLLKRFDDDEFPSSRKAEIILTLGKTKAVEAVDRLIKIIEDKNEEKIWRMYACDALGKIGDIQAVAPLKKLFNEDDALIRAYVASALARFKLPEVIDILIQGLKDANWKVRIQAAQGLADKNAKAAFAILKYKVEKDPVNDVKIEALKAIGGIGEKECYDYLRSIYTNEKQSYELRDRALELLIKYDIINSLDTIKTIVERDLQKDPGKSPIIELTGKRLFLAKAKELKEIFALFLDSKNMLLRIYGIRGAANNQLSELKDKIEKLSENDPVDTIKKEALSALTKF